MFMKAVPVSVKKIYVPTKFRGTLDQAKVQTIAESIVDKGLQTPIQVREDKDRYVLVAGLHRLEAVRFLGAETIQAFIVHAKLH